MKKPIILWNDNEYARTVLKTLFGEDNVITSPIILEKRLKGKNHFEGFFILAELAWDGKRMSEFYGFEIMYKLRSEFRLKCLTAFCSFMPEPWLRKQFPILELSQYHPFIQLPNNIKTFISKLGKTVVIDEQHLNGIVVRYCNPIGRLRNLITHGKGFRWIIMNPERNMIPKSIFSDCHDDLNLLEQYFKGEIGGDKVRMKMTQLLHAIRFGIDSKDLEKLLDSKSRFLDLLTELSEEKIKTEEEIQIMNDINEIAENQSNRYEIVLLEDDPQMLKDITEKLEYRSIKVYGFTQGDIALSKILEDTNIGALVTDIEIRYPFPNGTLSGLQGPDVVNKILTDAPNRLLGIIVLTSLPQEEALDSQNEFLVRIHNFSKMKWLKYSEPHKREEAFDDLAKIIKYHIEQTPYRWCEEISRLNPKSRWIVPKEEKDKTYPPYWKIYRKMWMSPEWKYVEPEIGKKALEIVQSYKGGERLRLQGDHLTLTENPNDITFREHLIGRRVVYALRIIEPYDWENIMRGSRSNDDEPELPSQVWTSLPDITKSVINKINKNIAELENTLDQLANLNSEVKKIERKKAMSEMDRQELIVISEQYSQLDTKVDNETELLKSNIGTLDKEFKRNPVLQQNLDLYLRKKRVYLSNVSSLRNLLNDFSFQFDDRISKTSASLKGVFKLHSQLKVRIDKLKSKESQLKTGGKDPFQQTLRILGIRKEDIAEENFNNWGLILPEERKWLIDNFNQYSDY